MSSKNLSVALKSVASAMLHQKSNEEMHPYITLIAYSFLLSEKSCFSPDSSDC